MFCPPYAFHLLMILLEKDTLGTREQQKLCTSVEQQPPQEAESWMQASDFKAFCTWLLLFLYKIFHATRSYSLSISSKIYSLHFFHVKRKTYCQQKHHKIKCTVRHSWQSIALRIRKVVAQLYASRRPLGEIKYGLP